MKLNEKYLTMLENKFSKIKSDFSKVRENIVGLKDITDCNIEHNKKIDKIKKSLVALYQDLDDFYDATRAINN